MTNFQIKVTQRFEDHRTDVRYRKLMLLGLQARDWKQVSSNLRSFAVYLLFETVNVTPEFIQC